MRVYDPRAGTHAPFVVETLEPFAIVQGAQRVDGHALQAPDILFATVGEGGVLEGHGQALRSGLVLASFGLQGRAQRSGEPAPATTRQVGEVLLERIDADVRLGRVDILGR